MSIEEPTPRSRRRPPAAALGAVIVASVATIVIIAVRLARERGTHVAMSMRIDRPAPDVFAFVSDSSNDLQWLETAVERRKVTAGPVGAGTRFESTDRLGPRTVGVTETIIEFEQDRRVKTRVTGAWDGTYEIRVDSDDGDSVLSVDMAGHGNGVLGLFDLLPDAVLRRQYERDAGSLKALLERRGERLSTKDDETAVSAASAKLKVAVAIEPEADSSRPVTEEAAK